MNRKQRVEKVKEEIRALKAQHADLAVGADLLLGQKRAQLEFEIEAKERELVRLTNGR